MSESTCRHCGRAKVNRPRGLCWSCYYTHGVRDKYEAETIGPGRGILSTSAVLPLAPRPCPFPAGSEERIQCYADRAAAGYAIFHPDDHVHKVEQRPARSRGENKPLDAA